MKKILPLAISAAMVMTIALTGCDDMPGTDKPSGGSTPPVQSSTAVQPGTDLDDGEEYVEGGDYGYIGDVMHTYFMNFAVNSAYTCDTLGGYTPSDGNQLLVVDLGVKNTMTRSLPMYDTDFQAQWGDSDDDEAYAWPITSNAELALSSHQPVSESALSDEQLPEEYEISVNGEKTGLLIYEVPVGEKDFSVSFQEYFDDNNTGDIYFVYFTAEAQA